ncbi:MAG TPA: 2-hydroxyacyl-CoA dehydratase [Candidatus Cloacimonadota bacterium]|nr:2-hydroxyacyl-CoA dehydratase [Candidatus Cloacimonadota bacterium]
MKTKRIGFTTSFPVEVVYAAGHVPVDLNNIFLTMDPARMVQLAEIKGFPRTICAWIKGNFSSALAANLDEVIGIVQGDCSNSASLAEMIREEGMPVHSFSFPVEREYDRLDQEVSRLEEHLGVTRRQSMAMKLRLDAIRSKLVYLDELTFAQRKVSGKENHLWLVNSSDFEGDPDDYERRLDLFLQQAEARDPLPTRMRMAFLGVPPIFSDIYDSIIEQGGDVIFNEVQRQFAMPQLCDDIVQQYLEFTYPYSVKERLEDITAQIKLRQIDAVISYTQSFCHLQIDNLLLKKHIDLPFLTLEGDQPGELDSRTILRLESFFEVHG